MRPLVTGTRWYAPISYSQVKGFGGPRLVREHHSGAQYSSSPVLFDSVVIPPVAVHQSTHCAQYLYCDIPSDWVVHNSPSGYMYHDGWHKFMARFVTMCCSSPRILQVLFYYGHGIHFDDREINILSRHHIQYSFLKAGGYVHDPAKPITVQT